jgi:hypothetical protein
VELDYREIVDMTHLLSFLQRGPTLSALQVQERESNAGLPGTHCSLQHEQRFGLQIDHQIRFIYEVRCQAKAGWAFRAQLAVKV